MVFPRRGLSCVRPSLNSLVLFQMNSISEAVRSESLRKSLLLILRPPIITFLSEDLLTP